MTAIDQARLDLHRAEVRRRELDEEIRQVVAQMVRELRSTQSGRQS